MLLLFILQVSILSEQSKFSRVRLCPPFLALQDKTAGLILLLTKWSTQGGDSDLKHCSCSLETPLAKALSKAKETEADEKTS